MSDTNHYDTLDIPPSADLDAIKRAYRRQMRQHHPDQYIARREALRQKNDQRALRDLERTIAQAQAMTQRINAAYRVLSDPQEREKYDRDRRLRQAQSTNVYRTTTPVTVTRNTRPASRTHQRTSPRPNTGFHQTSTAAQAIPWAILSGFLLVMFIGFSVLSTFLGVVQTTSNYPTASGISASSLQATTMARQATYIARTQAALAPTSTPLSQNDLIIGANNFYRQGSYNLAVENYNEAISREPDNAQLRYLRARALISLMQTPRDTYANQALTDLDRAITLDPQLYDAYRERGLLYTERWRTTRADADATQARADLDRYLTSAPADADVRQALAQLPPTTP